MSWLFFLKCCKQNVEDPLEHPLNLRIRRDSVVLFDSENESLIDASYEEPENIIENEVIKGIDTDVVKDIDIKGIDSDVVKGIDSDVVIDSVVGSLLDSVVESMEPSMN